MRNVLFRARESFARDQRGNVAILFAFTAVPLIGLLGGAVDVTRHQRYEMELAERHGCGGDRARPPGRAVRRGSRQVRQRFHRRHGRQQGRPDAAHGELRRHRDRGRLPGLLQRLHGHRLPAGRRHPTRCRSTSRPRSWSATGKYEIALALDNTGSMDSHGRIEALRDAAGQLVDDLYKEPGTEDRVKMALIPFVTTVNIKTPRRVPGIVDRLCRPVAGDRRQDGLRLQLPRPRRQAGQPRDALQARWASTWKGCVEARADAYDEDDTAPTSAADPLGALSVAGRAGQPRLRQQLPEGRYDRRRRPTGTCCATPTKYAVKSRHDGERHHEQRPERRLPARRSSS